MLALVAISLERMRLLILLLVLLTQSTFGQKEKIRLFDFKNSTCDEESDPTRLRTRIVQKKLAGDVLTVTIATVATCCVTFKPKAAYKSGILYLDLEENGRICFCDCCYELIYEITGIKDENVKIKFRNSDIELSAEKFKTYPIHFRLLNSDTIDYVDSHGLRQGK